RLRSRVRRRADGASGAGHQRTRPLRAGFGPAVRAGRRSRPGGRRPGAVPARRLGDERDRSVARHRRAPAVSGRGRSDRDRTGRAPGGGIVKRETPVERKARARKIIRLLERAYPDARIALTFSDPLELLVATILSAQCTDERVNQVTPALFKKYRTAAEWARLTPPTLEPQIRSTGFYRAKARSIIGMANALVAEHGGEVPRDRAALTALPGARALSVAGEDARVRLPRVLTPRLIAVAVGLLFALAIVEVGLRFRAAGEHRYMASDPLLHHRLKPNLRTRVSGVEFT